MSLKLIVGPPNSGRAGEVRRRLVDRLDQGPVLVVPTADDASWFERELCAGGRPTLGVSIRTFGWFFEDVAGTLALEAGPRLTAPQRLALVRAAIATTELSRLRRSAGRPGFAPALDALIAELQGALVAPAELAERAGELDDGAYERELAALYASYLELLEHSRRSDAGTLAEETLRALRVRPDDWEPRPVFLYGFDDLTAAQRELIAELSRSAEVTVAVNYADREALAARAGLVGELVTELGALIDEELPPDDSYTAKASLRHLDRSLFEPDPVTVEPDDGIRLLECAGERGEAEAIGLEIADLLGEGVEPDEIAVVLRHPARGGATMAAVLAGYGIPVALEAETPLDRTAVGRALVSLCRAASSGSTAQDLLAHLRADPAFPASPADWLERRIRRGEVESTEEAVASWRHPPRHLARLRAAGGPRRRMLALAATAREIAEARHRDQAPLASSHAAGGERLHPVELRAALVAAEILEELAALGDLPACPEPALEDAVEAIEGASVASWRGPTEGRVRILSPYRLRAGRARYLFCASLVDGEFPAAAPPDPLLGEDRRAALGIAQLRRRDQADEERYLFHACASRPTERLYLSWRGANDEGSALARSPFVDEVLDLIAADRPGELIRRRGLEEVVAPAAQAPSERELARALALRGRAHDPAQALERLGVDGPARERVLAALAATPPDAKPGPLRVAKVLEELRERRVLSANQLEGWLECPYRWFVQHELRPVRLEPESDPLWLGGVVHAALEVLYREAPGADAIPRPGDVGRWKRRFGELLDETVGEARLGPVRTASLARAREQVERFLEDEAASETTLRPRPELIELDFGFDGEDDPGGLDLGEFALRGKIDRIDLAADGKGAVVRDYKTGARVPGAAKFAETGTLQIPLYMRVAERRLGLEPIGGLYQPLGAAGERQRKARGLVRRGDERLEGLELVRGKDHCEDEGFEEHLEQAEAQARRIGAELRAGEIGRRPLNGRCPDYCAFQPICRLERALGLPAEGERENGE